MGKPTTYTFEVLIDLHNGARFVAPHRVAKAIYHAISAAQDADIPGTEILDGRFGQITVRGIAPDLDAHPEVANIREIVVF